MARTINNIEIYMGPKHLGRPDNLTEVVQSFVLQTKHKITGLPSDLENSYLMEVVKSAKNRGVTFYERADFTTNARLIVRDDSEILLGFTDFTEKSLIKDVNSIFLLHTRPGMGIDNKDKLIPLRFTTAATRETDVLTEIFKATEVIDFAAFNFPRSSQIFQALLTLSKAGIRIRGLLNRSTQISDWTDHMISNNPATDFYRVKINKSILNVQHKLMVIDEQVIIAGQINESPENYAEMVIIGDHDSTDPASVNGQRALAAYALEEIDRIISGTGEKLDPS